MDKKYIQTIVALNTATSEAVAEVQAKLEKILGFKPSRAEAIAYVCKYWKEGEGANT
jgi:hypothetical protein